MLDILRPRNSFGRSKFWELNFTIPPPRDGEELAEISSSLNLTQLGLSDEGNYSCAGVNSQGNGESDYLFVEVSGSDPLTGYTLTHILLFPAPPRFLKSLPEMTTLVEGEDIEFQCQVRLI